MYISFKRKSFIFLQAVMHALQIAKKEANTCSNTEQDIWKVVFKCNTTILVKCH